MTGRPTEQPDGTPTGTAPGGPAPHEAPAPPKGFKARLRHFILHPELSEEQVALSFALGFCICWNPLLGLHTWLVLGLCFLFRRLHMPLMLLGAFINNPWTMVPIATASAYFGNLLMGRGLHLDLSGVRWHDIGLGTFTSRAGFETAWRMLKPVLTPYLLGGFILSAVALPVGYYVLLRITRKLRSMHLRLPHMPHLHLPHPHPKHPKQGD